MVIKIPAFQKFEKVNTYMMFSFKPFSVAMAAAWPEDMLPLSSHHST